ncbi:MAG: acyl-CoA synthetase [Actinomycetota bacterium]
MVELNLAALHEAIAERVPDRECLVFRDRRLTWADVTDRTRRLANALRDRGLGQVAPRSSLDGHQSGQDHLACYLHNGNEYLEAMLGSYKARVAPYNVNYRYVAEELEYLLRDAGTRAIVFHSRMAATLDEVRHRVDGLDVLLQVDDGSGLGLLDGAEWYEDVLAASSSGRPDVDWSPDDLYILYTGGTTGMPKGVLWRQADVAVSAFSIKDSSNGREWASLDDLVDDAADDSTMMRFLPSPPFMHGAGHWNAFSAWGRGAQVVIQGVTDRLDADDVLRTIERERVDFLLIVGDAYGQPLLDALDRGSYDLSSLRILLSGGAALSAPRKARFLEHLPDLTLIDGVGSSEAGGQMRQITVSGQRASTGTFVPEPESAVLSEELGRVLAPGHEGTGWLAKGGRIPLGYLGDAEKTAATFPAVDGVRYSVPGDRARHRADGIIELHGRDSVTINTGGEKVFAEEVEAALSHHPDVYDVVVAGRPSERWGQEVVAIVRLRDGSDVDETELLAVAAEHVARYKLPKCVIVRDEIVRSPAGKADYRWARAVAVGEA